MRIKMTTIIKAISYIEEENLEDEYANMSLEEVREAMINKTTGKEKGIAEDLGVEEVIIVGQEVSREDEEEIED